MLFSMPTKAAMLEKFEEVKTNLDNYKKYVGKNFMSSTEQSRALATAIKQLRDEFVSKKEFNHTVTDITNNIND